MCAYQHLSRLPKVCIKVCAYEQQCHLSRLRSTDSQESSLMCFCVLFGDRSPFDLFFKRGLNVSLSTDDPLQVLDLLALLVLKYKYRPLIQTRAEGLSLY